MTDQVEILLVEDNPADADLAAKALRKGKIVNALHVVENGVEALDYLYRRGKFRDVARPDLVLLDLNLPKKDGREVLAEIKQDHDLKQIPVVVLTTSEDEKDILRSYDLHANSHITKPVDLQQFMRVIHSIEGYWLAVVKLPPKP